MPESPLERNETVRDNTAGWLRRPIGRRAAVIGATLACVAILAAPRLVSPAAADEFRHGLSAFGDLKYPPDFKHFAYVRADAPKGGRLVTIGTGAIATFDSFNRFILKGDVAQGIELTFDSLMVPAADEPDSYYGLVASSVAIASDRSWATFRLRPEARFADGTPITADDCVFSFETLKQKGHPFYRNQLADVVSAVAIDRHTIKYAFTGSRTRNLPATVAALPVLSRSFYATRNFEETTLEPPLGSGPYKVGDFKQGTYVTYVRRQDYWGKDLPVMRGRFNFDEIRYDYFRERLAGLQALKAGVIDLREEFTAKEWATAYDIPAVAEKRLLRDVLEDKSPSGTQGWWINTRRAKFSDARVRRALDLAFDYEWTNKNVFYDLYSRTTSFFESSPMKATGEPSAAELKLLMPFKDKLPAAVFEAPYIPPVSNASGNDRRMMSQAARLLSDAGYEVKNGQRVNAKGEVLDIEFLISDPGFERILSPYVKNLTAIGVQASIRRVDDAQYQRRVKSFDYDIISARFIMSLTPGPELRNFFGSEAARTDGTFNLAGISDPVVDHLITAVSEARSRDEMVTAARALDRVLRAGHYWVPHWFKGTHTIAFWDKFARPPQKPPYDRAIVDTWWYDTARAAKLKTN
jgi:microcin C transport system substrate-binding protein